MAKEDKTSLDQIIEDSTRIGVLSERHRILDAILELLKAYERPTEIPVVAAYDYALMTVAKIVSKDERKGSNG